MVIALLVMAFPVAVFAADGDENVTLGGTVYTNSMTLENKDTSAWTVKVDGIGGTLGYNASGNTFVWGLEAQGLPAGDYALIYYADETDRFTNWGGANPGAVIGIVTADSAGVVSASGDTELNMDLPCPPDINATLVGALDSGYDYTGAKIWLVPVGVLSPGNLLPVASWNPDDSWLFETALINYDDLQVESAVLAVTVVPSSVIFPILVPGQTASGVSLTITNTGTVPCTVTASVPSTGLFQYLLLNGSSTYSATLAVSGTDTVALSLPVPAGYPTGTETGTLTFSVAP
jgi:hypothetical protein